ncbi:exported hypothetical protein [Vibrio nigripulchritudo FTn2]|uniref:hypothetical protein n=1 Tax=Vibrio nigripulchritudo TaxID=28173 RepID=UPI0003B221F8|nr:hypothetical protein [Vibrio nigripulchritudo]CCN39732.1 exported hypothetical protein [Vibrio nigripulchritudo FTn2]
MKQLTRKQKLNAAVLVVIVLIGCWAVYNNFIASSNIAEEQSDTDNTPNGFYETTTSPGNDAPEPSDDLTVVEPVKSPPVTFTEPSPQEVVLVLPLSEDARVVFENTQSQLVAKSHKATYEAELAAFKAKSELDRTTNPPVIPVPRKPVYKAPKKNEPLAITVKGISYSDGERGAWIEYRGKTYEVKEGEGFVSGSSIKEITDNAVILLKDGQLFTTPYSSSPPVKKKGVDNG